MLNVIPGASSLFSKEETLSLFRTMCTIRYFELEVKKAYDAGIVYMPVYLGIGQEAVAASLAAALKSLRPAIFAQHRAHGTYLAFGGDLRKLRDEILHKETGCARGMGGSASIHSPEIRMYGHDGFMGTQVPIGVGYTFARNYKTEHRDPTLIIMGDASAEEDYVLTSLGYASHKKLPVLFICEDNNLSILTEVNARRHWKMADIAKSFGMESIDVSDDPWTIVHYAKALSKNLPAYLNIHTTRNIWHVGTGSDGSPEWDRFALVQQELERIGVGREAKEIEESVQKEMRVLWAETEVQHE